MIDLHLEIQGSRQQQMQRRSTISKESDEELQWLIQADNIITRAMKNLWVVENILQIFKKASGI